MSSVNSSLNSFVLMVSKMGIMDVTLSQKLKLLLSVENFVKSNLNCQNVLPGLM